MERGEQLPAGEPHADRLAHVRDRVSPRFVAKTLAVVMGLQALTGVAGGLEHTEDAIPNESATFVYHDVIQASEQTEYTVVVEVDLPSEPVIADIVTTTTSTTLAPSETTTTTIPPETTATLAPVPESTTTTVVQQKTCRQIIRAGFRRMRAVMPLGWTISCKPANADFDGMTFPKQQHVDIYFRDIDDSDNYMEEVVVHEFAHVIQTVSGISKEAVTVKDPVTGKDVIDPATGQPKVIPRYTTEQLEEQADSFAYYFSYTEKNKRGSEAGAIAVCQLFAEHGFDLCR